MRYYVYENWTAEHKAVIHKGTCRYCNEGQGCQENSLGNKMVNGMDHLIHLKKRDQQQKILVGQFVHVVDVYKFNGEMARRAYGKGV